MSGFIDTYLKDLLQTEEREDTMQASQTRIESMLLALTAPLVRCEEVIKKCEFNHMYGKTSGALCPTHRRHFGLPER